MMRSTGGFLSSPKDKNSHTDDSQSVPQNMGRGFAVCQPEKRELLGYLWLGV